MMQRNTLTPAERMARRQQAKEKRAAKKEATRAAGMTSENKPMPTALLAEYKALRYDYRLVSQQHRRTVQDAAVDIRRKQARVMEDLLAIGRRLVEVKDLLPHGQFGRWIEDEFELSERVAQGMMNAAKVYSDEAKARRVALLSDGALYLLVAPSTPEAAREQVETIIPGYEQQNLIDVPAKYQ